MHDALCLQSNYACLWKKYGDACMILHSINDDLIQIRLPSLTKKFDENKIKDTDGCIILNKLDLFQRAQKYFEKKNESLFIVFCYYSYLIDVICKQYDLNHVHLFIGHVFHNVFIFNRNIILMIKRC